MLISPLAVPSILIAVGIVLFALGMRYRRPALRTTRPNYVLRPVFSANTHLTLLTRLV
jgi:hypothetical protein